LKYADLGEWESAEKFYCQNMSIFPAFAGCLLGRARARFHLGKYSEAIRDLEKSMDLSPRQTYVISDSERAEVLQLLDMAKALVNE
jgi:hypothetical protein